MRSDRILPRLQSVPTNETSANAFTMTVVVPTAAGTASVVVNVLMFILTTSWTVLRFYSRRSKGQPYMLEDILCLIALISFYGLLVCNFIAVYLGGSGHHIAALQSFHITRGSKAVYGIEFLYAICLGLTKIGLIITMKRVFFVRRFQIAAWVTISICMIWSLFTILIGLLICWPVSMNWDASTPGGKCGNEVAAFAAVGIFDLATDFFIIVLPIPMLFGLRMKLKDKIGVFMIFGAGILTMVFGALRLYYVSTMDFTDVTATQLPVIIMGTVQPGIAIVVSSSPLLKPVFDAIFRHGLSGLGIAATGKDKSTANPGCQTTLLTFGGAYTKGKLSKPLRSLIIPKNSDRTNEDNRIADLELHDWRDHEHEVTVTASLSLERMDGNRCRIYEDNGSEDGILTITTPTKRSGM